jgi:positive regulator of sigma E activity
VNLFYTALSLAMVIYNLIQALNGSDVMNYILAAMWLAIGIFCAMKHVKDKKKAKKKQQMRQRGE